MEPVSYLSGLRRRWWIILVAVALGACVGWATRSVPLGTPPPKSYVASSVILGSSNPDDTNLKTLSQLTTVGPVPRQVAKKVGYQGDPRNLGNNISTEFDQDSGIMSIDAEASTPIEAQRLANVFANQLVKYSVAGRQERSIADAQWLRNQMNRLATQIKQLEAKIASASGAQVSLLTAQRDSSIQAYGLLVTRYQQVTAGAFEPSSLQVIQKAGLGKRVSAQGILAGPVTLTWRIAVAALLGLVLGVILALVLERVDRRIRTREGAERSFGLPVLAEVPAGRRNIGPIVTRSGEVSSAAEPLPLLGALLEEGTARLAGSQGNGNGRPRSQTILVTSPTSAEGKSNVVARLAKTYAEEGKTVLVVSSDFHGDGLDRQFGVSSQRGLSDALQSEDAEPSLRPYVVSTAVPNVWLVPSGRPPNNGGAVLGTERMRKILKEARSQVDVVLVDAAPVLTNGDAPHLLRETDSVLLVARSGKTTAEDAKRSADILARLDAPIAGVALRGARR